MRPFQIVLLAGFAFLAVVALIFLSVYETGKRQEERAYGERVSIWGTLPQAIVQDTIRENSVDDKGFNVVEYQQVSESTFVTELVNAIAEGRSPDLIILNSTSLVQLRSKLFAIPYSTISQRNFKDSYVDGAEVFAFDDGIYGVPFAVDPMVMYWNRDLFSSNGLAQAPTSWEEVVSDVVPQITTRDTNRNVLTSGVAFGVYQNIQHAKETLLLLSLQSGSKMVTQAGSSYSVSLNEPITAGAQAPLETVVQFYTDFSNVNSPLYSWNQAMPTDKNAFLAGDLGLYFGFGSEYSDIEKKNPNLNFDMAMVPQGASATALRTYGDFYAFAIPRASKNAQGAFAVAQKLANAQNGQTLASGLEMSSVQRSVIAQGDGNPFRNIILQSALIARSWLDPKPSASDDVFMQMVEDIISNRARIGEAIGDAIDRLSLIY
jgi:ABC-type glycerol-3-phosphate transport system substrate-binding protein